MEIERKFLIRTLPDSLDRYPYHIIEQAYIWTNPVIRIRRQDDSYILTCKGSGMLSREECNIPMSKDSYEHLLAKTEGCRISKRRCLIPLTETLTAELDIFSGDHDGLVMAEVEFPDEKTAEDFIAPSWFGQDVTYDPRYHNSWLSTHPGVPVIQPECRS